MYQTNQPMITIGRINGVLRKETSGRKREQYCESGTDSEHLAKIPEMLCAVQYQNQVLFWSEPGVGIGSARIIAPGGSKRSASLGLVIPSCLGSDRIQAAGTSCVDCSRPKETVDQTSADIPLTDFRAVRILPEPDDFCLGGDVPGPTGSGAGDTGHLDGNHRFARRYRVRAAP